MKATMQFTLFCECGRALEYVGITQVRCVWPHCKHKGALWKAPTFELEPVEQEEPEKAS